MKLFTRATMSRLAGVGALAVAAATATAQTMPPPAMTPESGAAPGYGTRQAPAASGQTLPTPQTNWSPPVNGLPAAQEVNGVRYVTGGFGETETNAFRKAIPEYRLGMVFSQASGAFVANVPIRIRGTGNAPSLDVTAVGPFLLIDLPAGRYRIQATYGGRELTRDVTLAGGRGQRVGFAW